MELFISDQFKPYLRWVEQLLYPYRSDFSKPILSKAKEHLTSVYKQYQFIKNVRPIHPNDEYYFALFDSRERHQYFYRAWAASCILFYMRPRGFEIRSSDEEIFARGALSDYLYTILENGSKDVTVCPQCFLDAFRINIVQRRIDII